MKVTPKSRIHQLEGALREIESRPMLDGQASAATEVERLKGIARAALRTDHQGGEGDGWSKQYDETADSLDALARAEAEDPQEWTREKRALLHRGADDIRTLTDGLKRAEQAEAQLAATREVLRGLVEAVAENGLFLPMELSDELTTARRHLGESDD